VFLRSADTREGAYVSRQGGVPDKLFSGSNAFILTALSAATVVLIAAAVIGARGAQRDAPVADRPTVDDRRGLGFVEEHEGEREDEGAEDTEIDGADTAQDTPGSEATPEGPQAPGPDHHDGDPQAQGPATRTGVEADHIRWGIHLPVTLNGAPLNIADHFAVGLKGYVTYINREGGVHGRKLRLQIVDDEYTTAGGRRARDRLAQNEPFVASGALGVDQIDIVARWAAANGIPYFAAGGPEDEWAGLGMFQVASSYDQWMEMLVRFLCSRHGQDYVGEPIRIGTTTLNSDFIIPVEQRFIEKLTAQGCIEPVDNRARQRVQKPDEQTTYRDQLIRLSTAYNGQGANLVVPLQDPITTSRQVQELRTFIDYNPKWTFSSFVHETDTTLTLMGGEWAGVRGLAAGCYYMAETAGDPNLCAQLNQAHARWVSLGQVTYDENAGGCAGGRCDYNYNEASWRDHGQGGSAGYQWVHFLLGALREIGDDPTRERFTAALENYENYSDLVSRPITFRGSPNRMIGAIGATIYEGQSNNRYRQLTNITPGIVEHF
jgi:hypothetical protein